MPSALPVTRALQPGPGGLPGRPFLAGRASGSCRDTSRAAGSAGSPESRARVRAAIWPVRPAMVSSPAIAASGQRGEAAGTGQDRARPGGAGPGQARQLGFRPRMPCCGSSSRRPASSRPLSLELLPEAGH
jgi:hypothetical protein